MAAKRDIVIGLDKMKILSDRGIIKKHEKNYNLSLSTVHAEMKAHMDSVAGSFRKLEVDWWMDVVRKRKKKKRILLPCKVKLSIRQLELLRIG